MVFVFIEKLNLWNFIRFGHSTPNTLLTGFANSWHCKNSYKKLSFRSLFVSCDFEIGIHFGDVELKWNGIKHAKVILIFERNYANMYQPYVMLLYVYAKSASHSYCTDTRHDDAMPCEYSERMLWRHSNETCIELRVNDLTGKKPFG